MTIVDERAVHMAAEYFWTLPTRGDGRTGSGSLGNRGDWTAGSRPLVPLIRDVRPGRFGYFDHLGQIGRAAAVSGFTGVHVPFDPQGEESWIVAAALARELRTLDFVTEFSPAFSTPVYATKMSATFQRFSGGRLRWKLAVDADPAVARGFGDYLEGADRYVRAEEFLDIAVGISTNESFTYRGRFFEVEEGGLKEPLTRYPRPAVTLAGTSPEALALSAKHADLHLWDWSVPTELEAQRTELDRLAETQDRRVRHGAQLAVFARETADEAWDEVRRLWLRSGAGGWDQFDELVIGPDLWAGFQLIGQESRVGVVGSYEQVAAHLHQALDVGIETFYLAASPRLEEAYRFGEYVAPLLGTATRHHQAV
jgi:alkanesulfonate monooxygenase